MKLYKKLTITIACLMLMFSLAADAQIVPLNIGEQSSGWAIVMQDGTPVDVTVNSVGVKSVNISLDKVFTGSLNYFGFFDPIVIEFMKTDENATLDIVIESERVTNNTTHIWQDYHMFLTARATEPKVSFDLQSLPYGDQLEGVQYSRYDGFEGLPVQLDFVNLEAGGVSNQPGNNIFAPGSEYGQIRIMTFGMEVGERFALKEFPTVPEPTTVILLGLGMVPAIIKRKNNSV